MIGLQKNYLKIMEKEKHKLKQIIRGERFVNVPKIKEVSDVLQQQVVADNLCQR